MSSRPESAGKFCPSEFFLSFFFSLLFFSFVLFHSLPFGEAALRVPGKHDGTRLNRRRTANDFLVLFLRARRKDVAGAYLSGAILLDFGLVRMSKTVELPSVFRLLSYSALMGLSNIDALQEGLVLSGAEFS